MNTPRLLIDPDVPEFQRELLRAWSDEGPSSEARERAKAFAALACATGMAAGAGGAAARAGAAGGSIAPKAMSASGLAVLKWVGVGSVLAGLIAGGAMYARSDRTGERAAPGARLSPPDQAAAASPSQAPASQREPASTTLVSAPVASAPSASAVAPSGATRTRSSSPGSALSDQIASLDRVRAALAAGDSSRAVQLVDDYERRFPRGAFFQEAEMLRIEALVREGNRDAASSAADRFLATYPASPHIARLRALTGSAVP